MDEQEIKDMWQRSEAVPPELRLKPDLDKFENRYRYLLRNTSFLYERKFQLGLTIVMTLISVSWFWQAQFWYSYVLCCVVSVSWFYNFYLTDRVRNAMAGVPQDEALLIQMKLRKIVLERIYRLRIIGLVNAALMFILIWSLRLPERRYEGTLIIGFCAMFVLGIAAWITTRKKLLSTRNYLNNIIAVMEKEE